MGGGVIVRFMSETNAQGKASQRRKRHRAKTPGKKGSDSARSISRRSIWSEKSLDVVPCEGRELRVEREGKGGGISKKRSKAGRRKNQRGLKKFVRRSVYSQRAIPIPKNAKKKGKPLNNLC